MKHFTYLFFSIILLTACENEEFVKYSDNDTIHEVKTESQIKIENAIAQAITSRRRLDGNFNRKRSSSLEVDAVNGVFVVTSNSKANRRSTQNNDTLMYVVNFKGDNGKYDGLYEDMVFKNEEHNYKYNNKFIYLSL